jgi:hypothetical protein
MRCGVASLINFTQSGDQQQVCVNMNGTLLFVKNGKICQIAEQLPVL